MYLNAFINQINPAWLGLEWLFAWLAFTHKPLSWSFLHCFSSWKIHQRLIKHMSIDILDFSFNSVMESYNSSLPVLLTTSVCKMPVTPKRGTCAMLFVFWCYRFVYAQVNMTQGRTCMRLAECFVNGQNSCSCLKRYLFSLIVVAFW